MACEAINCGVIFPPSLACLETFVRTIMLMCSGREIEINVGFDER